MAIDEQPEAEPTLGQRAGPLNLNAEGAELNISSSDGSLIMRLWADSVRKEGPDINVAEGVLQFEMSEGSSLLVRVSSCLINIEDDDLMTVSGDIKGNIRGTGQYFSGSHLSWDRSGNAIEVDEVYYVGPNIEVRGERMTVELDPDNLRVTFDGPVEAGV